MAPSYISVLSYLVLHWLPESIIMEWTVTVGHLALGVLIIGVVKVKCLKFSCKDRTKLRKPQKFPPSKLGS